MMDSSDIYSRFDTDFHVIELFAEPIKNEKAYINTIDFALNYAIQNKIDTGTVIRVNNRSELFLKLSKKTPVLINVFPSQNIPRDILEIPEALYQRYISNNKFGCRIYARVPDIAEAVNFYGAGNDAFELLEKWKIENA